MSINRFSPGFANCQTSGFLLLLDFARKCNFVERVYCCKNLKTPSINFLQKVKADYLMKRQEIYSFLFFLAGTNFTLCHSVTNGRCLLTVSACICFSLLCTKCIYRLRSSSSVSPKEKPCWLH